MIDIYINKQNISVLEGTTLAAALYQTPPFYHRISVTGQPRTAFCGMGVCQECRVQVDGLRVLACQTLCYPGMIVELQQ